MTFNGILGLFLLGGLTSVAVAAPGDSVRVGDAVVSPSVDLGLEYRTNVFRAESDPIGGMNLRAAPKLDISIKSAQNQFSLTSIYEVRPFLFVGNPEGLSPEQQRERMSRLLRFNDFDVGANANLFQTSRIGLVFTERVSLRNFPNDRDIIEDDRPFASQLRNSLFGGLRIDPTDALEFQVGARWAYDDFKVPSFTSTGRFNQRHDIGPQLKGKWTFLPRTAAVLDMSYRFVQWDQNTLVSEFNNVVIGQPNSNQARVTGGLRGRLTERLVLGAVAGYGGATYDASTVDGAASADISRNVSGLDGILVSLDAEYAFSKKTKGRVAYRKDFIDAYFTNFVGYNLVDATLNSQLTRSFGLSGAYGIRFEEYEGTVTRSDIVHRASLDGALGIRKWVDVRAGVWWMQRDSEDERISYDDIGVRLFSTLRY